MEVLEFKKFGVEDLFIIVEDKGIIYAGTLTEEVRK